MSKGSKRRPRKISEEKFTDNWDKIFNKGKDKEYLEGTDFSKKRTEKVYGQLPTVHSSK